MKIQIVKAQDQARGAFDFGRIKENKPIGFPHEGGITKPVSNLFYWAHAWSDEGGLIDEHPHQGFEIMSYVIRGELSHYDNKHDEWKSLKAGDAQLIKAGNGITHAEKFLPGADIFQIWFDPNLKNTLGIPASYQDFPDEKFITTDFSGYKVKTVAGKTAPLNLESEDIGIDEIQAEKGQIDLELNPNKVNMLYLIYGKFNINASEINRDDFITLNNAESLKIDVLEKSKIFRISVPEKLTYQTYAETQGRF